MTLAQLFKSKRLARGVTQKDIAELLEVSANYISDIECGRRPHLCRVAMVANWSMYLGITLEELASIEE